MNKNLSRETLINEYLYNWRLYKKTLDCSSDYKKTNKLAKVSIGLMKAIDELENPVETYLRISELDETTKGTVAMKIAIYEPEIAKKMYKEWYESDPVRNFFAKDLLDDWDDEIKRRQQANIGKVTEYLNRKK